MAGPRREMRVVELVEAGALDDAPPAHGPRARPGARRRDRRARDGWPAAVALVAVVVVAVLALGGSVLADRREDDRLRAIAGRPDVVAPLDGPVGGAAGAAAAGWARTCGTSAAASSAP